MATEEMKKEVKTEEGSGKTVMFKEHIQKIIYQQTGFEVSKDKAWNLFKAIIHGTVQFVLKQDRVVPQDANFEEQSYETRTLSLAGVGKFSILESKARGKKAGLDADGNKIDGVEPWETVPRFRFRPSSMIERVVNAFYGHAEEGYKETNYGIYAADEPVTAEENPAEKKEAPKGKKAPAKAPVKPKTDDSDLTDTDEDMDLI